MNMMKSNATRRSEHLGIKTVNGVRQIDLQIQHCSTVIDELLGLIASSSNDFIKLLMKIYEYDEIECYQEE